MPRNPNNISESGHGVSLELRMKSAVRILLALLGIGLALVLGEGLVRAFHLGPDIHEIRRGTIRLTSAPGLRYELLPNVVSTEGEVLINAHGMRNRPVTREKAPGIRRIACIGDSIAFGMGARRETFSVQLERELNAVAGEARESWEVLNFGVPGYQIGQVAAMLTGRAAEFGPDLVLYLYCLNDPQETSKELEEILRGEGMTKARMEAIVRILNTSRSWLGHSRLWQLARLAWAGRGEELDIPRERYLDDMEHLLAGRGMAYYRALYADEAARERLQSGLNALAQWSRKSNVPVWVVVFPVFTDLKTYPLEELHAAVATAAETEGLRVVDLLAVYRAAAEQSPNAFHADPLHPNEQGYGLAARAVARIIEEKE